jgi:hypothetical protein
LLGWVDGGTNKCGFEHVTFEVPPDIQAKMFGKRPVEFRGERSVLDIRF